jgi:hypothetical protein
MKFMFIACLSHLVSLHIVIKVTNRKLDKFVLV